MAARAKPMLLPLPAERGYFEHSEHTDECLREQLEELIERMDLLAHVSDCGCRLCHKYEVLARLLLAPFDHPDA